MGQIVGKQSQALLIVAKWNPSEQSNPAKAESFRNRRRLPPAMLGILGTLLIHVIVLKSVVYFGSGAHKAPIPETYGPGSIAAETVAASDQSLVLLQPVVSPSATNSLFEEFALSESAVRAESLALKSRDLTPELTKIKVDTVDPAKSDATSVSGDSGKQAHLAGIYSGQIRARIERIWRRPRTPVSEPDEGADRAAQLDETFQCQVQIVQDNDGEVQEVMLTNCNGSPAWQRSLVMAINQASPLPAPPDPAVFSQSVTLTFLGFAYSKGSAEDEYEIPPQTLARAGNP